MATINFYYRSKKPKINLTAKLRFSIDKDNFVKTAKIPTETSFEVWDKYEAIRIKDAEVKKEVNDLRTELTNLENHILKAFNDEPNKYEVNSKQWLNDAINSFYNKNIKVPENLVQYIDHYLKGRESEISEHLKQKFQALKSKLEALENTKDANFKIIDVNESFKNLFVSFLTKNNYSKNYIRKQFGFLKQLCNHAKYNGLEVSHQLDKLNIKGEKTPKIYLTLDEIEQIEKTNFETENLNATKDWLIISVFTGQRVSDFMRFTIDMIRTENGKKLIEFTQKKTGKIMTIPVHKKVLQIIEANGGQFPKKLLDQKYNNYLKEVCKMAEVNEPTKGRKSINIGTPKNPIYRHRTDLYPKHELISSHVGRRSFATNFYGKIPTTFLIYITGHSTEAMFLNYIGKSNKDLAIEVSDYFNAL